MCHEGRRERETWRCSELTLQLLTTAGEADEDPKLLILHDDRIETLWALGERSKGVSPEVITWVMNKLDEAGYRRTAITLTSDQEESNMAPKQAIAARRET